MKPLYCCALILAGWSAAAQPVPGPAPGTNSLPVTNTNVVAVTNRAEIMRRRLREAFTNPTAPEVVVLPNAAGAAVPPATPAVIAPTNAPATPAPKLTETPANVVVQPAANPQTAPAPNPNVPAGAVGAPGAAAAAPPVLPGAEGAAAPAAPGVAAAPAEDNIPLNLQNMPLDQALDMYAGLVGRTMLRQATIAGAPNAITLKTQNPLSKAEAIEAFKAVFALNSVTLIDVGEKFVKVVPSNQGFQEAQKFSQENSGQMSELGQYTTKIVQLKNTKPSAIVQALTVFGNPKNPQNILALDDNNIVVLRDFEPNVKRMLELIEKIDVVPELDYKLEVIPIKYGKVEEIYEVMSSVIGGGGAVPGRTQARAAGARGGAARPGQPGIPGQFGQQATPAQPTVGTQQRSFQDRLNQIVTRAAGGEAQLLGDAKITPDMRANALIVYANKVDMIMITNIIAKVDVPLSQVLIEAIIMEVSLDNGMDLGVSYLQRPRSMGNWQTAGGVNNGQQLLSAVTNLAGALPSGFSYFGQFSDQFDIAATAVARDSRVNILSRPRIQTTHAVPASFEIGNTVPYIQGTSFAGSFGASSYYQEKRVTTRLDVTPFITPDGLVVMDIIQTIDQLGPPVKIDQNEVPTTTTRSATATVSVRDRETIMLGGFISANKTKSKSGVPFLKDIPGLGILFRSSTDKEGRVELVVLMRPTVLLTPQDAAALAKRETENLPGLRQAEMEFRDQEEKRRKKAEAEIRKKGK